MADYTNEKLNPQVTASYYDYLIIGGGMAADTAARGIREQDSFGTIGILSSDNDEPYTRPALTKKLWTDSTFTEDQVALNTTKEIKNTTLKLKTTVTAIEREHHRVQLEDGTSIQYKKLLLVTGGEPKTIDGPDDEHVIPFREWSDYRRLRDFSGNNQHVVVVGGGYIGSELAAGLIQNNTKVTLVYPDEVLGGSQFPSELAKEYETSFREAGVELLNSRRAESYTKDSNSFTLYLDDGSTVEADTIVIGLGVSPRVSLAEQSGLKVEDGVYVDEQLRTTDPDIWAAGDIAYYPDKILGRTRIEHVDHARKSGKAAGKAMAGSGEAYTYTPYFYSVVFSISWKAIGTLDSSLTTLIDEVDDGKVVYYLEDNLPVGILTWNVEPDLDAVRAILSDPPTDPQSLRGMIRSK